MNRMALRKLDLCGLRLGRVAGCYAYDNDPSGFMQCGEILDWLNNYWLRSYLHAFIIRYFAAISTIAISDDSKAIREKIKH